MRDAAGFEAARHAQPLTAGNDLLEPVVQEWRTVGHLYRGIEAGVANLCAGMAKTPCSSGRPDRGPPFDIARPATFLLPHQGAAWKIIKERLDALERACTSLGKPAGLGALAPLAGKLHSMGQDIGTYIPGTNTQP